MKAVEKQQIKWAVKYRKSNPNHNSILQFSTSKDYKYLILMMYLYFINQKYEQIELVSQQCEYLRQSIQESTDHIEYFTKSYYLAHKDIKDDILIWLVYLQATQKGIETMEIQVIDEYPYIKLNRHGEIIETIYENLVCWLAAYLLGSKFINHYQQSISDTFQQIEQEQIKVICMQMKLDQTKTDDILKKQKSNIFRIKSNIERIEVLSKTINNPINHDYINEVMNYIRQLDNSQINRLANRFNRDKKSYISEIVDYLGEKADSDKVKRQANQKWANFKQRMGFRRVNLNFYYDLVDQYQLLKKQNQQQEQKQEPDKIEDIIQLQQRQEETIEQPEQIIKQENEDKKSGLDQQYEQKMDNL